MLTILLLVEVSILASNIKSVEVEPATWIVDDDGPADFHTIQEAINHACEGDSIFVKTGTYNENVVIDKSIFLIGEKSETTKVCGTKTGPAIHVEEADNVVVKCFTFEVPIDTRHPSVNLYGSIGGFFTNNIVISGFFGIRMSRCKNVTIEDNKCNNNYDYGILIGHSSNNVIRSNNVTNTWYGIGLWSSSNNIIANNYITGTGRGGGYPTSFEPAGILLWNYSSKNQVIGNKIYNNKHNGISIASFSTDNLIINNVVSNNWHYSVWLEENSTSNTFYHNLFDGQKQVYIQNCSNMWNCDYPCGGNYWSDYSDVDFYKGPYQNETGSDGIGDTPYVIDDNNIDNYPLAGHFKSFNTSLGISCDIVSNSTIEDFQFFATNRTIIMHVSNTTADQTYGFCRLTITHDLIAPPYNITVNNNPIGYSTIFENETLSIIYFTYEHSTLEIIIIPEFPATAALILLITFSAFIIALAKKSCRLKQLFSNKSSEHKMFLSKPT